ncbi:aspartate/ornithine carbamoyltransferase family protein [Actinomyces israelii]|uniref:aspartate/ornithine carbamoyltransferase family protein n=1 Tax=Actinomyces israelii TaxID=1659 RepID=UPI002555D112|nr:aspartate carbamoyltransferase [Actinomyces israelii]WKR23288.1 Aspartate carbamoyltransferase [Actinomyces israelii]
MSEYMRSMKGLVDAVDHVGKDFISITDMTNDQLYSLFDLGKNLELFNRSRVDLLGDRMLALMFFQPSTRTRMSFQTAMERLGGHVIVEANPKVTSSVAKEESIEDTMRCVSQYANLMVIRHYDAEEARRGARAAECPVINGGWGHWEHPTQALLDLYTMWRRFGRIEGLNVAVVSPDMIEARTGHSMAAGLARFGANVTICSDSDRRTPAEVRERILSHGEVSLKEEFDFEQDTFNEFVRTQDLIYLPGCSAPAGAKAEEFKTLMDRYLVRYETLQEEAAKGHQIYVTHTLPRRAGEMDLRIDDTPHQLYFRAILQSVSIRMALVTAILGL